ncbi:futalosine hydrolase [Flavobacteriales bacterium]|nr:futalosine hydrolase [Flavobacteriales bacterium]
MNVLIVAATKFEVTSDRIAKESVLITGVGMINTAIHLTKELMKNKYEIVINMGVVGSFSDQLKNGDVVEVVEDNFAEIGFEDGESLSKLTDFDIKTTFKVEGKTNLKQVKSITVNTVHGNENAIKKLVHRLNPDVESMEGAAVFAVCEEFNIPCVQIRSISNKVEKRNKENWNIPLAIKNLNTMLEKIIIEL